MMFERRLSHFVSRWPLLAHKLVSASRLMADNQVAVDEFSLCYTVLSTKHIIHAHAGKCIRCAPERHTH